MRLSRSSALVALASFAFACVATARAQARHHEGHGPHHGHMATHQAPGEPMHACDAAGGHHEGMEKQLQTMDGRLEALVTRMSSTTKDQQAAMIADVQSELTELRETLRRLAGTLAEGDPEAPRGHTEEAGHVH